MIFVLKGGNFSFGSFEVKSSEVVDDITDPSYGKSDAVFSNDIMHQSIPSTNIPPVLTPGEFFKVVKFPAPRQKIFAKLRPRGKKI